MAFVKNILNVYYQNVGGLGMEPKQQELRTISHDYDFDVFILVETKLNKNIKDKDIFDRSFNVIRKDLKHRTRRTKSSGGVLVALKKGIIYMKQNLPISSRQTEKHHVECLWITINLEEREKINIFALYLHKECSPKNFMAIFKRIEEIYEQRKSETFLIAGDFNFHYYTNYVDGVYKPKKINGTKLNALLLFEKKCGLIECSDIRNDKGKKLDMIFSSKKFTVFGCPSELETQKMQHKALCFDLDTSTPLQNFQFAKMSDITIRNSKDVTLLENITENLTQNFDELTKNLMEINQVPLPMSLAENLKIYLNDIKHRKEYFEASLKSLVCKLSPQNTPECSQIIEIN